MSKKIYMHFAIPAERSPAPHMISGEPAGALPLSSKLREKIGHQGLNTRLACDPRLQTSDAHRATGEPWALLLLIEGVPTINDSDEDGAVLTCQKCLQTEEWKAAYATSPHPHAAKAEDQMVRMAGCC